MTRYEVSLYIGPCSQEEAEALMEAITDLPEAHAVGAGAVGLAPFEESAASSVSAEAGQVPADTTEKAEALEMVYRILVYAPGQGATHEQAVVTALAYIERRFPALAAVRTPEEQT